MSAQPAPHIDVPKAGPTTGEAGRRPAVTRKGANREAPAFAPERELGTDRFPVIRHWVGLVPDEFQRQLEPLLAMAKDPESSPALRRSVGAAVHYLVHLRKLARAAPSSG